MLEIVNGNLIKCYDKNIKNVIVPDCVIQIGRSAFSECYLLKTIKLPLTLEKINSFAFSSCENLRKIIIEKI